MKDAKTLIASLLDELDAVYTPRRKQAIKERMEGFWRGEKAEDRIPYTAYALEGMSDLPEDWNPYDRELVWHLSAIVKHGKAWGDDFYPALAPGVRQLTLPSYFGCAEEFAESSVAVKPIVTDAMQVYDLPRPGFTAKTAGGDMLSRMGYWREATQGRIAIYETDMQGPFSVASQVWGIEDFLLACYDAPDEVHYLINACTEALIEFTHLMYKAVGDLLIPVHCQPCLWYPKEKGMAVSEDLVAVVSPAIVEEFMNPYLTKIADAFGGVTVHTCGEMNHVIPTLCQVEGLVGLNFSSSETDLQRALSLKRSDVRVICHSSPVNVDGLPLLNPAQHVERCGELARQAGEQLYCIVTNSDGSLSPDQDEGIRRALAVT